MFLICGKPRLLGRVRSDRPVSGEFHRVPVPPGQPVLPVQHAQSEQRIFRAEDACGVFPPIPNRLLETGVRSVAVFKLSVMNQNRR